MENSPTSFARNSVSVGPNDFKFGTKTIVLWSYMPYQNLVQIDHNLHNHVFDDVICKSPIASYLRFHPVPWCIVNGIKVIKAGRSLNT